MYFLAIEKCSTKNFSKKSLLDSKLHYEMLKFQTVPSVGHVSITKSVTLQSEWKYITAFLEINLLDVR